MIKFEDVFNFDNLYKSHLRARKGKRHKRDVVNFEINLFENLTKLEKELKNGTYHIIGYNKFMIYDPKEREIQALSYYDRLVQNCLCYNYLIPVFNKKLIYDNAACQEGKGTHFARTRFAKFIRESIKNYGTDCYVLKLDMKKYFNSINHTVLKSMLENDIYDTKLKKLVFDIIDSYEYEKDKGIPMGNQSSQIFALYYLNELDRIIKEKFKIKYYVRYMDDLVLIHNDKEYLKDVFKFVKEYVGNVKIELNKKSSIFKIKSGTVFLGVKYIVLKTGKLIQRISKNSKRRMIEKINVLMENYQKQIINVDDLKMSWAGFNGNIKKLQFGFDVRMCIKFLQC